jgi:ribonuclease E
VNSSLTAATPKRMPPSVDDAPYGDQDDNGNNADKNGRRRRRGRRGGRRGRERSREADSVSAEGGDGESEGGEQPEIDDAQSEGREGAAPIVKKTGSRSAASRSPGGRSTTADKSEPKVQRQRIWDIPSPANAAGEPTEHKAPASNVAAKTAETVVEATVSEASAAIETRAPAAPVRRRHEVGSSEPRIERVVVRPGEERNDDPAAEVQGVPQRKGWWQRKFGGE